MWSIVSYQMNFNWKQENEIIELVSTSQLWNYKEVDRCSVSKYETLPPLKSISRLCGTIFEKGFFEPILLGYHHESNTCEVLEGNTRLAYAKLNNFGYQLKLCTFQMIVKKRFLV